MRSQNAEAEAIRQALAVHVDEPDN